MSLRRAAALRVDRSTRPSSGRPRSAPCDGSQLARGSRRRRPRPTHDGPGESDPGNRATTSPVMQSPAMRAPATASAPRPPGVAPRTSSCPRKSRDLREMRGPGGSSVSSEPPSPLVVSTVTRAESGMNESARSPARITRWESRGLVSRSSSSSTKAGASADAVLVGSRSTYAGGAVAARQPSPSRANSAASLRTETSVRTLPSSSTSKSDAARSPRLRSSSPVTTATTSTRFTSARKVGCAATSGACACAVVPSTSRHTAPATTDVMSIRRTGLIGATDIAFGSNKSVTQTSAGSEPS